MEINKIFTLIENAVSQEGTLSHKDALYKSPATSDFLARGRFCQRCHFYTEEGSEGSGYCTLVGEVAEDATCRFFYGHNEGVREEPYIPILDIIKLEDNSIYLPLLREDSTVRYDKGSFYISEDIIEELENSSDIALLNKEQEPIKYKTIFEEDEILYAHIMLSDISILENEHLLGIKYIKQDKTFIVVSETDIDSESDNLAVIIILT